MLSDAIDMTGTVDDRLYDAICEVYTDMEKYEPYCDKGILAADVGIYYNQHGNYDPYDQCVDVADSKKFSRAMPHLDASLNVSQILQRNHIPFTVYTGFHPQLWKNVKVLIASDSPAITPENMADFKQYVADGGVLYLSGHSALPFVEEVFDCKIQEKTEEEIVYMTPVDDENGFFEYYTKKYPMTVYNNAFLMKNPKKGKVLATLTLPYSLQGSTFLLCGDLELQKETDPSDLRNESASMHADPPGIPTEYPAIIEADYGKGKVIWACAPFEKSELTLPRKIFANMIRQHAGELKFASEDAPYVVEYQMWEEKDKKYLYLVNMQYADEILPVFDFSVSIPSPRPTSIVRVSDNQQMNFAYEEGNVVLHTEKLDLYELYVISY